MKCRFVLLQVVLLMAAVSALALRLHQSTVQIIYGVL
jgi:hypothetical protein